MIVDPDTASRTAELLLQINAIKLRPENPFIWASGWNSPIYCDNRIILSYPPIRNYVREQMSKQIETIYGKPNVIAGVATGAIGIGMLVAEYMGLPFIYVRPKPKEHGRQNQIEGILEPNSHVVVIEDLISTGKSSLNAVKALKDEGAYVQGMIAIFTYGFPQAEAHFDEAGVQLYTLSDYENLIQVASDKGHVNEQQLDTLRAWRLKPETWNRS